MFAMISQRVTGHTQRLAQAIVVIRPPSTCGSTLHFHHNRVSRSFTHCSNNKLSQNNQSINQPTLSQSIHHAIQSVNESNQSSKDGSSANPTHAHFRLMSIGFVVLAVLASDNQASKESSNQSFNEISDKSNIQSTNDVFHRLRSGEPVRMDDPEWYRIGEVSARTIKLSAALNTSTDVNQIRSRISEITGHVIPDSTVIFIPFYTNLGINIQIGHNVFINHDCTFLDIGSITIEDDVFIGPKVSLITENHPLAPSERKSLVCHPITIQKNAWIGAGAIILPGVTVGENSVVAAGAVVSKDVPPNTIVAGVPAKVIRTID